MREARESQQKVVVFSQYLGMLDIIEAHLKEKKIKFAGIRGSTLIVNLPGSERAATENIEVILPALNHGILKLRGDTSDCGQTPQGGS